MKRSNQPLITDSQFLKREFSSEARKPKSWVRDRVQNGLIPGVVVGDDVFVDYPAWLEMRGIPRDTGVCAESDEIEAAYRAMLSR